MFGGGAKYVAACEPALLHGGAGERGEPNDVTGGVNVRHVRLIMFVDLNFAARIGDQAGRFDAKLITIGLAADGVDQSIRLDFLAAFEFGENTIALWINAHFGDFFAEAEGHADLAKMIAERIHNFAVDEIEKGGTLID